jgi:hypothetical protein
MFVILDTTEFHDAPKADSNSFNILEEYIRRTRSQLVIPEIVLKETVNRVREILERIPREIRKIQRDYDRIKSAGSAELEIVQPDFDRALRLYEIEFRERLERSLNAVILPVPNVTHESVVERALQRKRPFLHNKDGYRDTLIWLSIKDRILQHQGEYVFVTDNSKDFSEQELLSELGNLPQGTSLQFEDNLNGFINNHAKNALERLNTVRTELRRALTLPGLDLREELSDLRSDVIRSMSHKLTLGSYRYRDIEQPYWVQEYGQPENIQVDEVFRVQEDLIVECMVQYPCTIDGYVFHSDAVGEDNFFVVTDWDWNEHYAAVEFSATVDTKLLVRLSEEHEERDDNPREVEPEERLGEPRVEYSIESIEVVEAKVRDE